MDLPSRFGDSKKLCKVLPNPHFASLQDPRIRRLNVRGAPG
nr:unnamed protein product [Callosobruchus chinensis]